MRSERSGRRWRLFGLARVGGAALLLSALPGCWASQNQAASAEYARSVMTVSLRVAQLEQALLDAEARVSQVQEAMRTQGQEQAVRLENIEQVNVEVNRLRGQIEVVRFELDELKRHLESSSVDMERRQLHDEARLRQVERFLGIKPPPPPSDEDLGLTPGSGGITDGGTPGDGGEGIADPLAVPGDEVPDTAAGKLDLAARNLAEGRAVVARLLLERALKDHPTEPEIPEIRYRLGETWFNEDKWGQAITAFQSVIDHHGKSEWAPWAMLRQGESFARQGAADNAKLFYEEVIRVYPRSDAAKDARKALQGR